MRSLLLSTTPLAVLLCCTSSALAEPNVVLVSMDTTRADALSCYGRLPGLDPSITGPTTPVLDALAASGLRFERFFANAPTTLSSHTTMLSGRDPHAHSVPRNGFVLPPDLPTLPQRLSSHGYDTIAVVAAKALEKKMGLDRGFRVYDDHTPTKRTAMYQDTADSIVARTLAAVDARPDADKALFLFTHFYDPHAPYEAPGEWFERFAPPDYSGYLADGMQQKLKPLRADIRKGSPDPADIAQVSGLYQGEVAWVDHQIGVLLDGLTRRGLLDDALVVVTADHGETLHELPSHSYSHGSDVSEGSIRVPHIWHGTGSVVLGQGVVHRQADMSGLAATIEHAIGLEPTLGRDYWQLVRPGPVLDTDGWPERPTRPAFAEATRPFADKSSGWNNLSLLRSVRVGSHELRANPMKGRKPYVVGEEPGWFGDSALHTLLNGLMQAWDAIAPPWRDEDMDAETVQALEALGYLGADQ